MPDIELYNGQDQKDLRRRDTVVVRSDGTMTWIPSFKLTSTCKIDTTWFPFDDQDCELKFGSWVYNGFKVNLQLVSLTIKLFNENCI